MKEFARHFYSLLQCADGEIGMENLDLAKELSCKLKIARPFVRAVFDNARGELAQNMDELFIFFEQGSFQIE